MPALDGIRILDMTQYEAGTSCTQALAWLGADVTKIEPTKVGEPGRGLEMGLWQDSEYFINWNSNKNSVAINLRDPKGRDILLKMLPHYDVFVENYGPGVVEKLNIDYDTMKKIHPGIIYGRIKGFGTSGPYSKFKSYDTVAQAASGAMSITGEEDGPPMRIGLTIGDSGAGMQLCTAILAAYIQRLRTNEGQLIELSMQEAMTYYMRTSIALGSKWGERPAPRRGNGSSAIINLYPCKPFGHNDYLYIMCVAPRMWTDLCRVIERPELEKDPRFAEHTGRVENRDVLIKEITKWTSEHTKHEAMKILGEGGVPCSATLDTKDLFTDPHLVERGFIHKVQHEEQGEVPLLGWPPRMSDCTVPIKPAPLLGTSTAQVLKRDLNLSDEELSTLHEAGVIEANTKP
ncbi:MAG: CoA transferase [Candidatus Hydrogenedentota bacterium]